MITIFFLVYINIGLGITSMLYVLLHIDFIPRELYKRFGNKIWLVLIVWPYFLYDLHKNPL